MMMTVRADLSRADLHGTIIAGADFSGADLACMMFEPAAASNGRLLPRTSSLALARHLYLLSYQDSPHGLAALRDALERSGDRQQERQLVFAMNYEARRRDVWQRPNTPRAQHQQAPLLLESVAAQPATFFGDAFNFTVFEITSGYGMDPGRPVKILIVIALLCSVPFAIAILRPTDAGAIYRVWPKEGIDAKDPSAEQICFSLAGEGNAAAESVRRS